MSYTIAETPMHEYAADFSSDLEALRVARAEEVAQRKYLEGFSPKRQREIRQATLEALPDDWAPDVNATFVAARVSRRPCARRMMPRVNATRRERRTKRKARPQAAAGDGDDPAPAVHGSERAKREGSSRIGSSNALVISHAEVRFTSWGAGPRRDHARALHDQRRQQPRQSNKESCHE